MEKENEIIEAVKTGDLAKIKSLLKKASQLIHAETDAGESIILLAVYYGKKEIAEYLLSKAAQLTIFEAAAVGREQELMKIVRENPEQVNAFSADGWTPLHLAAFFGHQKIAAFLIGRGADLSPASKNENGVTPLHSALANREVAIAEMLLDVGADIHAVQAGGWSPLHYAAAAGLASIAERLIAGGADIHQTNNNGRTPLDAAIEKKQDKMIAVLKQRPS